MTKAFLKFLAVRFVWHLTGGLLILVALSTILFAVLWQWGYFNVLETFLADAELEAAFTPTIDRGIFGRVTLVEGDCMPQLVGPGHPPDLNRCRVTHPQRRIMVREIARWEAMNRLDPRTLAEPPPLVASALADEHGFYELALPPGTYSVFGEGLGREYCDSFRGPDHAACTVTIEARPVRFDVKIDKAAY